MRYLLLGLVGLAELCYPRRVMNWGMRWAFTGETAEEVELRPWTVTAVRIEGMAFILLALRGAIRRRLRRRRRRTERAAVEAAA